MKNIFLILFSSLLLLSCQDTEKKIPGWYTFNKKYKDFTLSGELTYYKNKALKIDAKIETSILPGIAVNTTLVFKGTWSYDEGYLKENITSIESTPAIIGETILQYYKEKYAASKGDKVIEVNKEALVLQTQDGENITFRRITKY